MHIGNKFRGVQCEISSFTLDLVNYYVNIVVYRKLIFFLCYIRCILYIFGKLRGVQYLCIYHLWVAIFFLIDDEHLINSVFSEFL
jgi:hypothetical protein